MDELTAALELATEEELQQLTELLFGRGINPLDYFQTPLPIDVQSRDRDAWLDALDQRFRYLVADGMTVLRGNTRKVTYRQALIKVCGYLKIPYSQKISTTDLEAEVFLHVLGRTWKNLPSSEQDILTKNIKNSLAEFYLPQPLPISIQNNPLNLLFKGSTAFAVSSVLKPILLKELAHQFAIHFAKYQVAKAALVRGGATAATQFQSHIAIQMANRGMAISAARYGAVRTALGFLGPMLWTWFLADLGWRAIATNYGRVIPAIFVVAQIRLLN
ncbi:hypothetical protein [Okeania sp.]|uniref:YaaW family protein n=1 Tax=Okeania sp. TaxID=3100323 RepID=UPI002B4AD3ED|nr:hypothetical protein [Okeania sp.]MEB3339416.1 hypothetical protein [Okeania sp.]